MFAEVYQFLFLCETSSWVLDAQPYSNGLMVLLILSLEERAGSGTQGSCYNTCQIVNFCLDICKSAICDSDLEVSGF